MPNLTPKNFLEVSHLQSAQDSEFLRRGIWAPTFFGNAKFKVKTFLEYLHLQSAVESEFFTGGGHDTNFIWSHQI